MSIRAVARELYNAQQKVSKLEKELEIVSAEGKDMVHAELRHARAETQMLRKMLDGEKESSSFRQKFKGFGQ